jgi:hypothetical protein
MPQDIASPTTGTMFVCAAAMLWGGWVLLPRKIGTYFQPDDFAAVAARWHFWIWMFRIHLFGMVTSAMALVALAALCASSPARILIWPGTAVGVAGLIVSAVAAAYYYHFGAWGARENRSQPAEKIRDHVESLRLGTEYVTCLVRFGRVFTGLGLAVLSIGLVAWHILPGWIGYTGAALGVAAMALTMALPDHLALYAPVFHGQAAWLAATGGTILWWGIAPAS